MLGQPINILCYASGPTEDKVSPGVTKLGPEYLGSLLNSGGNQKDET